MAADLVLVDGTTFFASEQTGDVEARGHEGFFFEDVRHLSRWRLLLDGSPLTELTGRAVDHFSGRMVSAPEGGDPEVSVRRDRFVTDGFHEDVVVSYHGDRPRTLRLELCFGSDFADVMEAQEQSVDVRGKRRAEVGSRSVTLWDERAGYRRGTVITFSRTPRLGADRARFELRLDPHETWRTCIDVTPVVERRRHPPLLRCDAFGATQHEKMPRSLDEWLEDSPALETAHDSLRSTYRQSLLDLAALRVKGDGFRFPMPGGGLPWFMAVFGRDSLIASYQLLPYQAELARATLEALAEYQATEWDNFRDAEPGKILHELRRGTLAALGRIPHTPYYGTHDATMLFLVLLDEYERWSGDTALVRRLEPNARAALAWIEGPADLDGDGFLEYRSRTDSPYSLSNHCWKDSDGSIVFSDGSVAEPPLAVCELQGYAYDARLRAARLAREAWGDEELAARLERDAADLRRRFHDAFWLKGKGCYALALDGEKRQVDAVASNNGHLLWSGIVPEQRAASVARVLLREDLSSGWGVRSLSSREAAFNPLGYHLGTVWPHDTAIAAEGLRRYGFRAEASELALTILQAAAAFGHRLPEVFAGFARDRAHTPVEYPGALKPQAWAAGAPLLALRTLLGLDVVDGRLRCRPAVPERLGALALRGIEVRGRRVDATG